MSSLPNDEMTILRMRCSAPLASGTLLWSVLLPISRETVITHTELGQGGGVRQILPLRRSGCGLPDHQTGCEITGTRR